MQENSNAASAFSQLRSTLSKLYPIEHWAASTTPDSTLPFVPRFCWEFFRPAPDTLRRLGDALRSYNGSISWVLGPPSAEGVCLVAAKAKNSNLFVGYPPVDNAQSLRSAEQLAPATENFVNEALTDIPNLCFHLEKQLKLDSLAPKPFEPALIAPNDPPSPEATLDFVERGVHVTWIIVQSGSTDNPKTASDRHMLHFSVRDNEWDRIRAAIAANSSSGSVATKPEAGQFPLLSRIEESESAYFTEGEAEPLRLECLRVRRGTSDPLAIRGLDKLILICNWARQLGGDILLRAP
jgi:hypothetical protein